MNISPNVMIMTCTELKAREDAAFQRGVSRGKFEAGQEAAKRSFLGDQPGVSLMMVPSDSAWQPEAGQ